MKSILSVLDRQPLICWAFLQWLKSSREPGSYLDSLGIIRAFMTLTAAEKEEIAGSVQGRYLTAADAAIADIEKNHSQIVESWHNPYEEFHHWFEQGCTKSNPDLMRSMPHRWIEFVLALDDAYREQIKTWVDAAYSDLDEHYSSMSSYQSVKPWYDEVPDDIHVETEEDWESYKDSMPWD